MLSYPLKFTEIKYVLFYMLFPITTFKECCLFFQFKNGSSNYCLITLFMATYYYGLFHSSLFIKICTYFLFLILYMVVVFNNRQLFTDRINKFY